jgi:hypothetical protein
VRGESEVTVRMEKEQELRVDFLTCVVCLSCFLTSDLSCLVLSCRVFSDLSLVSSVFRLAFFVLNCLSYI